MNKNRNLDNNGHLAEYKKIRNRGKQPGGDVNRDYTKGEVVSAHKICTLNVDKLKSRDEYKEMR